MKIMNHPLNDLYISWHAIHLSKVNGHLAQNPLTDDTGQPINKSARNPLRRIREGPFAILKMLLPSDSPKVTIKMAIKCFTVHQ